MAKQKQPKRAEAKVEIVLPDGTKISARGPMAEQMARRLMDPQYVYPYWGGWHWYGTLSSSTNQGQTLPCTNTGISADQIATMNPGAVSVYNTDGSLLENVDEKIVADTIAAALRRGATGSV